MTTVFNILPQNPDTSQTSLLIELGMDSIAFTTYTANSFTSLQVAEFKTDATVKSIMDVIQRVIVEQAFLKQPFKKTGIVYKFPDSILIPAELMTESINKEMLEFVYGVAPEQIVKRDFLYKYNLYNVYQVPATIYSLLSGIFPSATHTHLYSVLPDVLNDNTGNHLYTIFSKNGIAVLLKKEGKLQVMQSFKYTTPEDVAYYLLNICHGFDAAVNETILHISGMLDKISALYTELHKYFLHIEFENLPENFNYPVELNKQSAHFFSHLFAIASCV